MYLLHMYMYVASERERKRERSGKVLWSTDKVKWTECYESHQPVFVMVTESVGSCPGGVTGANSEETVNY